MTKVEEIEHAVNSLPSEEYNKFRHWFLERDWANWELQLEEDSASGKLEFLCKEAADEKSARKLKAL